MGLAGQTGVVSGSEGVGNGCVGNKPLTPLATYVMTYEIGSHIKSRQCSTVNQSQDIVCRVFQVTKAYVAETSRF